MCDTHFQFKSLRVGCSIINNQLLSHSFSLSLSLSLSLANISITQTCVAIAFDSVTCWAVSVCAASYYLDRTRYSKTVEMTCFNKTANFLCPDGFSLLSF